MAGTAVLRIVVSNDSMKNATATSHGKIRLAVSDTVEDEEAMDGAEGFIRLADAGRESHTSNRALQTILAGSETS
jgi:hypothetical protein